jgi:hypothetical protein
MHTQIATAARRCAGLAAIPLLAACSSGSGGTSQGQVAMSGDDGGGSASANDGGTQGSPTACSTTETVLNMMIDGQSVSVTGSNIVPTVSEGVLSFQANGMPLDQFTSALISPGTNEIQQGASITLGGSDPTTFIVTGKGGTMGMVGGEFDTGTKIQIPVLKTHATDPSNPAVQTVDAVNMSFAGNLKAQVSFATPGKSYVEGCLNFVGTPGADQ